MAGEHVKELVRRTTGMRSQRVAEALKSWQDTANSLRTIEQALASASVNIEKGFGRRETGTAAKEAFLQAAMRVGARREQMDGVVTALQDAADTMKEAEQLAAGAPQDPVHPGTPPPTDAEKSVVKAYATDLKAYNDGVAALTVADGQAAKKIKDLLDKYDNAVAALAKIEGEPAKQKGGPIGRTPGLPGPGTPPPPGDPRGPVINDGRPPQVHTDPYPPDYDNDPIGDGDGRPPQVHVPVPHGPYPGGWTPDAPIDGGYGGGPGGYDGGGPHGGGGVGPSVLGGAAAGALGAPGLVRGIRGLLNGRLSAGAVNPIGASPRTGAPGSLGRSGALTPGSPVGRGGGAGGRGGRGGAGGRGPGAGGRGPGAVGAAGGRGRRASDQREGDERELFDDGQDWIDDEGAAPGVLD